MAGSTSPQQVRYDAFISYSHAVDGRLAPALRRGLHRFARPARSMRALKVFRDQASLSASPGLWPSIAEALSQSRHFILLASPEAARSPWVQREVAWWLENRSLGTLLIALTEGELAWKEDLGRFDPEGSDALPAELLEAFTDEPRWLDLRWARSEDDVSLSNARFMDAVADLAAPLHGRPKDELIGDDVDSHRRRRRSRRRAGAGLAVLALGIGVVSLIAWQQRESALAGQLEAERQSEEAARQSQEAGAARTRAQEAAAARREEEQRSESLRLVTSAKEELKDGEVRAAIRLALEALPRDLSDPDRPVVDEARNVLLAAVGEARRFVHFAGHTGRVVSAELSSDGKHLLSASEDKTVRIWDTLSRRPIHVLDAHERALTCATFNANENRVLSWSERGAAMLWDAGTGELVANLTPVACEVSSADFDSEGKRVAVACESGQVSVFDGRSGQLRLELEGPRERSTQVSFSPDGLRIVTFGGAGFVFRWDGEPTPSSEYDPEVWDARTGRRVAQLQGHEGGVEVGFSAEGELLATAVWDHKIRIWNLRTGRLERTMEVDPNEPGLGSMSTVGSLAFRPGGTDLVVTSGSLLRAWDTETGKLRHTFLSGDVSIHTAAFSDDGCCLAAGYESPERAGNVYVSAWVYPHREDVEPSPLGRQDSGVRVLRAEVIDLDLSVITESDTHVVRVRGGLPSAASSAEPLVFGQALLDFAQNLTVEATPEPAPAVVD